MSQSTSRSTSSTSSKDDKASKLLSSLLIAVNDQSSSSSTPCISPGTSASDKSSTSICFKCEKSPSSRCLDCNIVTCDQCIVSTCLSREHSIIPIPSLSPAGSVSSDTDMVLYCEIHGEPLRFYCKTCAYCICLNCTIWSHKEHNYTLIKGSFNKNRLDIILDIQNTKASIDAVKAAIYKADKIKQAYEKDSYNAIAKIKHEMHSISQVIKKREKNILEKLYWTGQAKYNEVARQTDALREMLAKLSNISENLDNCKNSNDIDIFMNREKCKTYINYVEPKIDVTEEKVIVLAPNYSLVEHMKLQCDVISVPINKTHSLSTLQLTLVNRESSGSSFTANFGG